MKKLGGLAMIVLTIIITLVRVIHPFNHSLVIPTHHAPIPESGQQGSPFNRNIARLILTKHARCRMECRHINEEELKEILHEGTVNYAKSQPNDSRGSKYALEGYTHEHQHLRVIFAPETNDVVVVTCIDLDNEWACGSCN